MTDVWIHADTGEVVEGDCPRCETTREECEIQVRAMERERRSDRAARTRAENEVEKVRAAKQDAAAWKECLAFYAECFPGKAKAMRSTSIKSERARLFFERLEAIDSPDPLRDVKAAIYACTAWKWVSFGRRVKSPNGQAQLAIDLADILRDDVRFDHMCQKGHEMNAERATGGSAT